MRLNVKFIQSFFLLSLAFCINVQAEVTSENKNQIWGMFKGNAAHTGYVPINIDFSKLKMVNEYDLKGKDVNSIRISQDQIFLASTNSIVAIAIEGGEQNWMYSSEMLSIDSPVYSDKNLYFQTRYDYFPSEKHMMVLNTQTGVVTFQHELEYSPYTIEPVVEQNNLYFSTDDYKGSITKIKNDTLKPEWTSKVTDNSSLHNLTLNDQHLYAVASRSLNEIDKTNGSIINTIQNDCCYFNQAPTLTEKGLVATAQEDLVFYSIEENKLIWRTPVGSRYFATDTKYIYSLFNNRLYALDIETGNKVWWNLATVFSDHISDIVVSKNAVIVSDPNGTRAFSKEKDHSLIWATSSNGKLFLTKQGLFIYSSSDYKLRRFLWN